MGEPCSANDACAERLLCAGLLPNQPTMPGTCLPPIAKDAACAPGYPACLAPYLCLNGKCTARPMIGEGCTNQSCLDGWCNPSSQICEMLIAVGGACDPTISGPQCGGGSLCEPASRTCKVC